MNRSARTEHAPPSAAGRVARTGLGLLLLWPLDGCAGTATRPAAQASTAAGSTEAASVPSQAVAQASGDAVAAALTLYLRLLEPSGGSPDELAGFLAAHPGWPNRPLLERRLDQALGNETDQGVLARLCPTATLATATALSRCAGTTGPMLPGTAPSLIEAARRAWVRGIDSPDQESLFLATWQTILTPSDQSARFARQEASGLLDAADRTVPLLPPPQRQRAIAELALRRAEPDADALAAALPPDQAADPTLTLDLARWLRKADRNDAALALWQGRGAAAESVARDALQAAFWTERDALARALLDQHRDADALAIAADPTALAPGPRLDSDFLSGWIALRRLHDPARAEVAFDALTRAQSVISRTRGLYWTGRARAARGDRAGAATAFAQAAAFPTSFYGQLAAARLADPAPQTLVDPSLNRALLASRFAALHPPGWTEAEAVRFAGLELARAAELLVSWSDPRQARAFLLTLDQSLTDDTDHALAASLAGRLGLPEVAVAIARSAGRHGLVLPGSGWPRPFAPPPDGAATPALVLAVMRQESSFDPQAVSPAGANGLMQVTLGSARDIARGLGRPDLADSRAALFDPATNTSLGSAYLASLLTRYGGVVPYALAGYNAGPHRADRWLAQYGDPVRGAAPPSSSPEDDTQARLLDWIETIPFGETRNYVERVLENQAVYEQKPVGAAG